MKQDKWWFKKEEKRNPNPRTIKAKANRDKLRRGKLLWCSARMIMNTLTGLLEKHIVQGTYVKKATPSVLPTKTIKPASRWMRKKREKAKRLAMAL